MTQDELNQYESTLWELEHDGYIDAPALIRKQQAEIEALKANQCKHESWKKRSDRMTVQCNKCGIEADELSRTYKIYVDITDEEIDELADKFGAGMEQFGGCFRHLEFARAILKKAQEK